MTRCFTRTPNIWSNTWVEMMMEMDKADNENQIDITSLLDLDLFLN